MATIPERVAESVLSRMISAKLELSNRGKVRHTYTLPKGNLLVHATDRVSIFDFVLPATVNDKGYILTALTVHWLVNVLTDTPNHLVAYGEGVEGSLPMKLHSLPNLKRGSLVVKRKEMVPIECIVRGYLTGSGWRSYQDNGTVCGIALPEGLHDGSRLYVPLFTPSTKAKTGHDENISFGRMVEIVGRETAKKLRQQSLRVFEQGSAYALERGIILADTKFEFADDGNLADEVLTPDSSRFWDLDEWKKAAAKKQSPPPHDKELVRNWGKGVDHPFETCKPGLGGLDPENPDHLNFVSQLTVPQDILDQTTETYHNIFKRLTGQSLQYFNRDVMHIGA